MENYKGQAINTLAFIECILTLFVGYLKIIQGFKRALLTEHDINLNLAWIMILIQFSLLNIMREVSLVEDQNECNIRHSRLDCRKKAVTNSTRQWGVYIPPSYKFTRHSLSLYMSGQYIELSVYSRLSEECSLCNCYFWAEADESCFKFNTLTLSLQSERNQRLFWNIKHKDWHLMSV